MEKPPMIIKDNQGKILAEYDRKMVETIKSTVAKNATDEELIDTLIAISVVAKRLAANLRQKSTKESEDVSNDKDE